MRIYLEFKDKSGPVGNAVEIESTEVPRVGEQILYPLSGSLKKWTIERVEWSVSPTLDACGVGCFDSVSLYLSDQGA